MKRKFILIISIVLLVSFSSVKAQNSIQSIKPGDKLPESFWQSKFEVYHNGKTSIESLSNFRDKLLVLDFWATWCGSCIKSFSFADSLTKIHSDKVAIILVNAKNANDNFTRIKDVMKKYGNRLPTILGDTVLTKMFPHRVIPHYIWIEGGQFRAATGSEFFNIANIQASFERRDAIEKVKIENQKSQ